MPRSLRLGLFARIALALAATGFLPLLLVSRQLVGVNQRALEEQTKDNVVLAARATADRVESELRVRRQLASAMARDPRLRQATDEAAWSVLREHVQAGEPLGLRAAALVDEHGENLVRAQLPGDAAINDRSFAAPGGDQVITVQQPGTTPTLRVGVPLGLGSLRLVFEGSFLNQLITSRELGEASQIVVIGRDRQVLFGSSSVLDGLPPDLLENALSGRLGAGSQRDFAGPNGERLVAGFALVDTPGWAVLSRQPLAVVEAVAASMRRRSWFAVGGAGLLILALCGGAYATIVRPLRILARAQQRLAGQRGEAEGGNEVQALAASFQALERSVRDREELGRVFLGRYQVVEIIGRGAMGTVFRGWDPKLLRPVALKTVRLDQNLDIDRRRRLVTSLMSEAVTGARFSHPNILQVYDVEDLPQATFIATEFVDGMSLDFLLWLQERLPAERVVPLGAAIASGLAVAHAHGVVHRDVKPSNILLGRDGAIKVSDFGIAGLVAATAAKGGEVFGTPGYLPPEALVGEGYDRSGDLFALGVLLYQSLAGRFPFGGKTPSELARRTVMGTLQPLGKLVPETPPALCSIVHGLLEKNPHRRTAGAAAVADSLEEMARVAHWRWVLPDVSAARDEIYSAPTDAQFVRTELLETLVPRAGPRESED